VSESRDARAAPHGHGPAQPAHLGGVPPTAPSAPREPERHERYTLIEFTWDVAGGVQPVFLTSRSLLH
jgi:hypothetical protein